MAPTTEECRIELERILKSESFSQSERHRSFLGYIAEETLAGRGDRLKGYTIAVEVFGKPAEFDAQNDPYVRVEAGRLRKRLTEYFHTEGALDPVRIELKRGSYAPEFRYSPAKKSTIAGQPKAGRSIARFGVWPMLASVAVLAVAAIAITYFLTRDEPGTRIARDGRPPSIRLQTFEDISERNFQYFADGLNQEILLNLDRYEGVWGPLNVFHGADLSALEISDQHDYRLDGTVSHIGDAIHVTARLIDGMTGEVLWSEHYNVPYVLADLASIQDDIASAIANTVREPFGPLADAEVRLIAGRDPNTFSAYECNVAFIFAVDRLSLSAREDAKSCLERYDSTGSLDETGLGALSFLYHLDYDDGFDLQHRETSSRDAAYDAAQRAVDINGNDVLAQMAMAFVHLAHRRFDQARIATERLMSLNPPMSTRGIVGLLMLKQGDREEGLRLIEAALTQTSRPTPSLYIGPTLFYMEQGDLPTAMSYAERMDAPEFTMFQVFWAALSAHLGQMDRARLNADTLLSMHPDFRVYGRELIGRWSLPPDVVDVLLSGLSLVGIDLD